MPHLSSETSVNHSIDLKANGEVSRMRSHKGNMPSLPQTKYCALCPAKFTRTTHLNRHLRSHTNERAHRCSICNAEFTRSDLLTRHKRTCGDSSNVNRSRRKSCQACAESKVKCNLQQPCSKCSARGRECVFINDPEASRNRKSAKKSPRASLSIPPSETDFSESATSLDSFGPSSPSSTFSFSSHGPDTISYLVSSSHQNQLPPGTSFGIPGISRVSESSSSACSSRSSPRLEYYDHRKMAYSFDALDLDSELNDFFPNTVDPFMDDTFSPCLPRVQTETNLSGWFETNRSCAAYGNSEPSLSQSHYQGTNQEFSTGSTNLTSTSSGKSPFSRQQFTAIPPTSQNATPFGPSSASGNPTSEELNHYMYLFFTEFSTQIPLFHRPTWRTESTHHILLSAMHACGALFAKTQASMDYISQTLTSSRDTLIMEFSKPTCTLKDHMCLILAVVLLQSIGLVHPRPDQRALSRMYHEILVMMIRKTGLIKLIGSWPSPDISSPHLLDNSWRDWARYETFKRALVLAYLQDCTHSVYYSSQPAFLPSEFEINLPSDDDLWRAQTSREWYQIQRMPSNYGIGNPRILGTSMQMALVALKEQTSEIFSYTVNPFSAFVLLHSILRDIFLPSQTAPGCIPMTVSSGNSGGNTLSIQAALHNWQRMWTNNPEAVHTEQNHDAPFVHNAIPFYWLARMAEGAKQDGLLNLRPLSSKDDLEDRYRMVKGWLSQVNATSGGGSQFSRHLSPLSPLTLSIFSHIS